MSDWIVAGFAQSLRNILILAVVFGAVGALGLYFGISWIMDHVQITIQ